MGKVIEQELRSALLDLVHFMKWHGTIYDDDEVWHAFEDALRRAAIADGVQAQVHAAKWDAVHSEFGTGK
jgi:hypothetical protein